MEYVNELYKLKVNGFAEEEWSEALGDLVKMVAPFAPHVAAELWQELGNSKMLEEAGWPTVNAKYLVNNEVKIMVQVNGKIRGELTATTGVTQEEAFNLALKDANVKKHVNNK